MKPKPLPSQAALKLAYRYDEATGILYHKGSSKRADTRHQDGYLCVSIAGNIRMAHRIIWKMINGDEPGALDHINGLKEDNRISNLRSVDARENLRNRSRQILNSSGETGVFWDKEKEKWRVRIGGKHYGYFSEYEGAVKKARATYLALGYHENHGKAHTRIGRSKGSREVHEQLVAESDALHSKWGTEGERHVRSSVNEVVKKPANVPFRIR